MKRIKKMVDDLSKAYPRYNVVCEIRITNYIKPRVWLNVYKATNDYIYADSHKSLKELTDAVNKLLEGK